MITVAIRAALAFLAICVCPVWAARGETRSGGWWQTDAVRACCSEADAVWADDWHMLPDGRVIAKVTGGGPRNHSWAPLGRIYEVPAERVLREPGNPTGRPILFIQQGDHHLYCFALGPLG